MRDSARVKFTSDIVLSAHQTEKITFRVSENGFTMIRSTKFEPGKNRFNVKIILLGISLRLLNIPVVYTCEAKLATEVCKHSVSVNFGMKTVATV